jgi:hypothetical protein
VKFWQEFADFLHAHIIVGSVSVSAWKRDIAGSMGENTAVCESDKKDEVHANHYAIVASHFNAFRPRFWRAFKGELYSRSLDLVNGRIRGDSRALCYRKTACISHKKMNPLPSF